MSWTIVSFGKHKGKTLPQIIWTDPDWFFWFYDKGESYNSLKKEAEEIYTKARNIKIPKKDEKEWVLIYYLDKKTGKFGSMGFLEKDEVTDTHMTYTDHIDFYAPRRFAGNTMDKTGYRNFLIELKTFLFGKSSFHMTL